MGGSAKSKIVSISYAFIFFSFCRDTERKRKVKELMASLADQEGEVKKMKGKKKK